MEITRGKQHRAVKLVLYGVEGIGKSTLASKCPEPLFIDVEGSTAQLDVARTPVPKTLDELKKILTEIEANPTLCKTLIIDTADWLEKMLTADLCIRNKWTGIENIGYGKGYVYLAEDMEKVLMQMDRIWSKGINVVFTAHAMMRKQELPNEDGSFDRWELKLSKKCAPLLKEWADALIFCNFETILTGDKDKKKAHGNNRVMYTEHHACWDAKNRFGLDSKLPMNYESIASMFVTAEPVATPEPVKEEKPKAQKKTKQEQKVEKVMEFIAEIKDVPVSVDNIDPRISEQLLKYKVEPEEIESFIASKGYVDQGTKLSQLDEEVIAWLVSVFDKVVEKLPPRDADLPFEI